MIVETAFMTITPGQELAFEEAIDTARAFVEVTPGCRHFAVRRGVERPEGDPVEIHWEQSCPIICRGFANPIGLANGGHCSSPYFAADPVVEHWADRQ